MNFISIFSFIWEFVYIWNDRIASLLLQLLLRLWIFTLVCVVAAVQLDTNISNLHRRWCRRQLINFGFFCTFCMFCMSFSKRILTVVYLSMIVCCFAPIVHIVTTLVSTPACYDFNRSQFWQNTFIFKTFVEPVKMILGWRWRPWAL